MMLQQMILVASPAKPFQFTIKRQPRRNFILQEYHDEIERLYKEIETSAQSELSPPSTWNEEGTLTFVRAVVQSTLLRDIADDADIFRSGGDRFVYFGVYACILRLNVPPPSVSRPPGSETRSCALSARRIRMPQNVSP